MNTHPTNEYLNRDRLTDLARFAVPDGHDLWPRIEQAARRSPAAMPTTRPGFMSLGLSRSWTAVGVLFIAATFAALGFGLAVLVLSNGHDQVPAAQPEANSIPAPTPAVPTASPIPSVTPIPTTSYVSTIPSREASHAKLEAILTGETLDRYRALPPAYQEALGLYTWQTLPPDLVRSAVKDKIDQWGDAIIPLPELLGEERADRFDGLKGEIVDHAQLLVSYYVLVLNTHSSDEARAEVMQQYVDHVAPPHSEIPSPAEPDADNSSSARVPTVAWPPLEMVLTKTAFARRDLLGPRVRERVIDIHAISSEESDLKTTAIALTLYEMFLLKAQPGLELPSLEDTLIGDDLTTYRGYTEAIRKSANDTFERGLFSLHYLRAAFSSSNSAIPEPAPDILEREAAFAMRWVIGLEESDPDLDPGADPTPTDTTTTPESWVSEDGFIQFTTGDIEDLFDDPLHGTHPWCIPPSNAPKEPAGPWLVPSKLPEGMEPTIRDQMFPGSMYRAFRSSTDRISMSQALCATRKLNPAMYKAIPIGDRTAYVTAGRGQPGGGSSPAFDPNLARSLVMDIGYGVVDFSVFGSVTVDDLVAMAASLAPEELTEAEKGPYPQAAIDALGSGFGPVYVPDEVPDGYEMFGQLQARQDALAPKITTRLSYVRTSDGYCVFHLNQAGLRRQFPDVVQRAQRGDETSYTTTDETGQTITATAKWGTVEIDGVTIYAQEFSAQPRNAYTDVYFQSQGVWFSLTISTSPYCDHSLEMVAEIASSLQPLQP